MKVSFSLDLPESHGTQKSLEKESVAYGDDDDDDGDNNEPQYGEQNKCLVVSLVVVPSHVDHDVYNAYPYPFDPSFLGVCR